MIPLIPRALLRASSTIILAVSIQNIILGSASKNKDSALHNISGVSIPMITDMYVFVEYFPSPVANSEQLSCGMGTVERHLRRHSIPLYSIQLTVSHRVGYIGSQTPTLNSWTTANLATVLLVTAFFLSYLRFDPFDWPIWGPFATVLGIIFRAGLEALYNSADREPAREFQNSLWEGNNSSEETGVSQNGSSGGPGKYLLVPIQRRRSTK
jgi:hypothetical protein